jgi:hypothetical protein
MICHCGNTIDNHNFRHVYENVGKVSRELDDNGNEYYVLDSAKYREKVKQKCARPNCTGDIGIHGTLLLDHVFEPVLYKYREINFTIPLDSQCIYPVCKYSCKDHGKVMTHHFTTSVKIEGRQENDVVKINHPEDEDIKIKWE